MKKTISIITAAVLAAAALTACGTGKQADNTAAERSGGGNYRGFGRVKGDRGGRKPSAARRDSGGHSSGS